MSEEETQGCSSSNNNNHNNVNSGEKSDEEMVEEEEKEEQQQNEKNCFLKRGPPQRSGKRKKLSTSSSSEDKMEQQLVLLKSSTTTTNKSPGIVYLSTIPYFMTVKSIRQYFEKYGKIDRIFLQSETRRNSAGKKERRYTEGWVEFKDKKLAKRIAATLNNTMVGGKRRSKSYECLWNIKYLSGFKWVHLSEQLAYEKATHQQKLRAEISRAKREANYFAEQIDKGENLKKLEEKVLKKGGLWTAYQRQLKQKKVVRDGDEKNKNKNNNNKKQKGNEQASLFNMIFSGGGGDKSSAE